MVSILNLIVGAAGGGSDLLVDLLFVMVVIIN